MIKECIFNPNYYQAMLANIKMIPDLLCSKFHKQQIRMWHSGGIMGGCIDRLTQVVDTFG
jgi:hypothetical protein